MAQAQGSSLKLKQPVQGHTVGVRKSRCLWSAFYDYKCHTTWPLKPDWPRISIAPIFIWGFASLSLIRLLDPLHPIRFPSPGPRLDYGPGTLLHSDAI